MASLLSVGNPAWRPFKQDLKVAEKAEHIEHVEDIESVEDVQVHDIHLETPAGDESLEGGCTEPSASLLTLPLEIRLRIYEMAYDATFMHAKLEWEDGLKLQLQGTSCDSSSSIRLAGSPFTLLRVCRTLNAEVLPMLPPISHVALQLDSFTEDDMQSWLGMLSDSQIARLRSFSMTGWECCQLKKPLYADGHHMKCNRYQKTYLNSQIVCTESCHGNEDSTGFSEQAKLGLCDRSLTLDLNAFERQFQAERFERIVNQGPLDSDGQSSQREFQKACYLLRVLDGCVRRPAPKAHPPGRKSQCGALDVVEAAVASFVSDEGDLVVTRNGIVGLLKAAMGSC